MPRTSNDLNTEPCEHCGVLVRYKSDIARHNKLHSKRDRETFKCTYEGCSYESLQKSNLKTHMNQHTGEKPYLCPDCNFCTSDPGCLTRHRKRLHNYVTTRGKRAQPAIGTKQNRRHAPYLKPVPSPSPSPDLLDAWTETPCKEMKADDPVPYTWAKIEGALPSTIEEEVSKSSVPFIPALYGLWPVPDPDPCVERYKNIDYALDLFSLPPQESWSNFDALPSWSCAEAQSQYYTVPEFCPSPSPAPSSSSSLDSESLFASFTSSPSPSPDAFPGPYVSGQEWINLLY